VARRIGTSRNGLAGRDAGRSDGEIAGLFAQSETELKPLGAKPPTTHATTDAPADAPAGAAGTDGASSSRTGASRKSLPRATPDAAKPAARGRLAGLATPSQPASAPTDPRLAWIDRTRVYRAIRERDTTIDRVVHGLEREFTDRQRTLGDVIDAWNSLVPPALRAHVSVAGVSAGTLTLSVASSGASYELSRALRDGLERRMVELLPGRVRRIKVRVGAE
jgi:hypothetical protein